MGQLVTQVGQLIGLSVLHRAAKVRFDNDEEFKTRSRAAVRTLQSGDPQFIAAWKRICAASRRQFEKIYSRLHIELVERGESFYNPFLQPLVDELKERGVAEESEGAQVGVLVHFSCCCVFLLSSAVELCSVDKTTNT